MKKRTKPRPPRIIPMRESEIKAVLAASKEALTALSCMSAVASGCPDVQKRWNNGWADLRKALAPLEKKLVGLGKAGRGLVRQGRL